MALFSQLKVQKSQNHILFLEKDVSLHFCPKNFQLLEAQEEIIYQKTSHYLATMMRVRLSLR